MVNTTDKRRKGDQKIKEALREKGFTNIYLFPHLQFQADYPFEGCKFDAIAWKEEHFSKRKMPYLMQFKNTKKPFKPSKALLKEYEKIERNCFVRCIWINKVNRKGIMWYDIFTGLEGRKIK